MKEIPLHGVKAAGRVALVDDEDYALVSPHRWLLVEREVANGRTLGPYARGRIVAGRHAPWVWMHKLITGWPKTDHVDHDGLNNQRANLRPTTTAQNNHNQRPQLGSSSRYKGVTWHRKVGKWQAAIKLNRRCIYLGVFASEEEAALAYNIAAIEAYGEYAYVNEVAA
jgi:AP2 domain